MPTEEGDGDGDGDGGDNTQSESNLEMCTSIRVRAYLLGDEALHTMAKIEGVQVFSQPNPSVSQPMDHKAEGAENERLDC